MEENIDQTQSAKKQPYIYLVVGAVIVLLVLMLLVRGRQKPVSDQMSQTDTPGTSEAMLSSTNYVLVSDFAEGKTVNVSSVLLDKPGYVVIHEDDGGTPGDVIGKSLLIPSGETQNIAIELDRNGVKGEMLYAMIHIDDGDGQYQFPGSDIPLQDESGYIGMMIFTVGANPDVPIEITGTAEFTL